MRCALLGLAALFIAPVFAQDAISVTLMTAGNGSAFLPHGQGIAAFLASRGINIDVKKSAGSNENLSAIEAFPATAAALPRALGY
jgi:TRAP-type uncharacterized transport system substrate-binding protein